jgi:hypothetical protein
MSGGGGGAAALKASPPNASSSKPAGTSDLAVSTNATLAASFDRPTLRLTVFQTHPT